MGQVSDTRFSASLLKAKFEAANGKLGLLVDFHKKGMIARGLTEDQALLVEKTLLWKNGNGLSNQASGSFSEKFRPHDTMHQELEGFDRRHLLLQRRRRGA